jgi:hypothetical protein
MQIQSPLADIHLSIDSIKRDGSMVRLDATQQPGQVPTTAYLDPAEVGQFVKAFLKPELLLYLIRLGLHRRRVARGAGLPVRAAHRVKHPTPIPW